MPHSYKRKNGKGRDPFPTEAEYIKKFNEQEQTLSQLSEELLGLERNLKNAGGMGPREIPNNKDQVNPHSSAYDEHANPATRATDESDTLLKGKQSHSFDDGHVNLSTGETQESDTSLKGQQSHSFDETSEMMAALNKMSKAAKGGYRVSKQRQELRIALDNAEKALKNAPNDPNPIAGIRAAVLNYTVYAQDKNPSRRSTSRQKRQQKITQGFAKLQIILDKDQGSTSPTAHPGGESSR